MKLNLLYLCLGSFLLTFCTKKVESPVEKFPPLNEFNLLNPSSQEAVKLNSLVFQTLLGVENNELQPLLVEALPEVIKTPEGGLLLTFNVRQEARWDNGKDVVAKDVEYSFKWALLFDKLFGTNKYQWVKDFKFHDNDFRKFTFIFNKDTSNVDMLLGNSFVIFPKDSNANFIANKLSVEQIMDSAFVISTKDSSALVDKFRTFNLAAYTSADTLRASGAFIGIRSNDGVVQLVRKKNWWADALNSSSSLFKTTTSVIKIQ